MSLRVGQLSMESYNMICKKDSEKKQTFWENITHVGTYQKVKKKKKKTNRSKIIKSINKHHAN